MASQDLHNNIYTKTALDFRTYDLFEKVTGNTIDTNPNSSAETGYESIEFILAIGSITGYGAIQVEFEHGDAANMSDAEIVDSNWILGNTAKTFNQNEIDSTSRYGYVGKKRYVRCNLHVPSGDIAIMGVIAVLSNPRHAARPDEFPAS